MVGEWCTATINTQVQQVRAGASGVIAPLIVHRFADGTVGYATGTVSNEDIAGAGSGAPIRGLVGDVLLPVAVIGQQIALNAALPGVGRLAIAAADIAQQVEQSARTNMALNLGGLLGSVGQAISGINTSGFGNVSQILGAGLNIASAAFTPQPAASPTYGPAPQPMSQVPVVRTMAMAPTVVSAAGSMVAYLTRPILAKIMQTLGRRSLSLEGAVSLIRKMGKFFTSPEAIAAYLGITVAEMAQLITSSQSRKRRRMNPANTIALRRSLRRLKSFDRLASRVQGQLSRGGRRRPGSRSSRCGTCRKSPCSC